MSNEMITAEDANKAFAKKGAKMNLRYAKNWIITSIRTLEKKHDLNDRGGSLLFPNDKSRSDGDFRDTFTGGEGVSEVKTFRRSKPHLVNQKKLLPEPRNYQFFRERKADEYPRGSIRHLFLDKSFNQKQKSTGGDFDLYAHTKGRSFHCYPDYASLSML